MGLPGRAMSRIRRSLSLRTALALGIGTASAIVFVEIADEVLEGESAGFDRDVAHWIQGLDAPTLRASMRVITEIGSVEAIVAVVVVVALWALLRRSRALAGVLVAVALVTEALNWTLKSVFRRERPEGYLLDVVPLTSFAFPSGHAMVSTAVYGTAAIVVARLRPSLAPLIYVVTALLVLAIGFSRIVLGVHWTTDVLAGFAAGGFVLIGARLALSRVRGSPPARSPAVASGSAGAERSRGRPWSLRAPAFPDER